MFVEYNFGRFSEILVDHENLLCCKRVTFSAPPPHNVQREVAILEDLQVSHHAHIVRLLRYSEDSENGDCVEMYFPFYEVSIPEYIAQLAISELKPVLIGLASGVAHLHHLGIIHRDICPNNLRMDMQQTPPRVIIIDLGIAWCRKRSYGESPNSLVTAIGTGSFRAPELLFGCSDYDHSVDLWALGCTMFQILHPEQATLFNAGDGSSDLMLISSIFRTLGTPTVDSWKDARRFRSFSRFQFHNYERQSWHKLLPIASTGLIRIVRDLVQYNTSDRTEAAELSVLLERSI